MKARSAWLSLLTVMLVASANTAVATTPPALPASLIREGFTAEPVGFGLLKWFGLDIYEASLWTPSGAFNGSYTEQPIAFSLSYRRGFSRDRLIAITRTAWRELGLAREEQQERWAQELERVWVEVRKGSNMTALVLPSGETRFYDANRMLGRIEDPAFGPAFLSIWLDARVADTGLGELRNALLNQAESS